MGGFSTVEVNFDHKEPKPVWQNYRYGKSPEFSPDFPWFSPDFELVNSLKNFTPTLCFRCRIFLFSAPTFGRLCSKFRSKRLFTFLIDLRTIWTELLLKRRISCCSFKFSLFLFYDVLTIFLLKKFTGNRKSLIEFL